MRGQRLEIVPLLLQDHIIKLTIPIAFVCVFFFGYTPLSFLLIAYYLLAAFVHHYVRHMEHHIIVHDSARTMRLFPNESGVISIVIENRAKLPLVNGSCMFRTDAKLQSETSAHHVSENMISFPFVLGAHARQQWDFTFTAVKRGAYHIKRLECIVSDPFHLTHIHLPTIHKLKTEILVYPALQTVNGLQQLHQETSGTYKTTLSYYRDEAELLGIKPYERESFRSIHWKASAKTQQLQAKVYQPVRNLSWSICLCLASSRAVGWKANMEELISYTAYICKYAAEKKIPFELFISVMTEKGPVHISMKEGIPNVVLALEDLARLSQEHVLIQGNRFVHYYMSKREPSATLIFVGVNKEHIPATHAPMYIVSDKGVVEHVTNLSALRG
jgi:hypothetical protein